MSIYDMADAKLSEMQGKRVKPQVTKSTAIQQDNFPETLGNTIVVNAPFLINAVWAVFKVTLDKKTRDKIKIYGKNYHKKLEKYCDKSILPDFLGGEITDWPKNKLPWDDYVNFCKKKKTFHHNPNGYKGSDPWERAKTDDFQPVEQFNETIIAGPTMMINDTQNLSYSQLDMTKYNPDLQPNIIHEDCEKKNQNLEGSFDFSDQNQLDFEENDEFDECIVLRTSSLCMSTNSRPYQSMY